MADNTHPREMADDTVMARRPPLREPTEEETLLAAPDATRVVRGTSARAAASALGPAPQAPPKQPAGANYRAASLLERHLGPPPPARPVLTVEREGLPRLERKERRFRLLTLVGLGVTVVCSGAGLVIVGLLW